MSISVMTLTGDPVLLPDVALEGLRMAFRGGVSIGSDATYENDRVVWNAMIDKRPAMIIRCMGTADVIDAVNFARMRNLLVAVRSGGHSVAGLGTCDGGMLIDLSGMDGVYVDTDAKAARVQGGSTWGGVDRETQAFGLAIPGGVVSNTGVAGLTLGGGIGYLRRKYGLSCDNLLSADVVTAEGESLRASAKQNSGLFWALRGGGGNFGVVTSFEFRTHSVGPMVAFSLLLYPIDEALEVFRAWRDWQATVSNDVTSHIYLFTVPEGMPLPEEVINKEVVLVTAMHAGNLEEGLKALASSKEIGTPMLDLSGPWPYRIVQSSNDPMFAPKGKVHAYFKSLFLQDLSDDAIDLIIKRGLDRPNLLTLFNLAQMGGAVSDIGSEETAVASRAAPFMLSIDGISFDGREGDAFVPWVRDVWQEMQRFASGGPYLNFLGAEEGQEEKRLVKAAYGPNYQKLATIKKQYDPDNFFRLNQNISPKD